MSIVNLKKIGTEEYDFLMGPQITGKLLPPKSNSYSIQRSAQGKKENGNAKSLFKTKFGKGMINM